MFGATVGIILPPPPVTKDDDVIYGTGVTPNRSKHPSTLHASHHYSHFFARLLEVARSSLLSAQSALDRELSYDMWFLGGGVR